MLLVDEALEGGDVGVWGDADLEGVAGDELLERDRDGLALLVVRGLGAVLRLLEFGGLPEGGVLRMEAFGSVAALAGTYFAPSLVL